LITDRTMDECCGDGGVHAAGEAADHAPITDERANLLDLAGDEGARRPRRLGAADIEEKVRDDLAATRRVRAFGMELHAEPGARLVPKGGDRRAVTARRRDEPWRQRAHLVAVAHPRDEGLALVEAME